MFWKIKIWLLCGRLIIIKFIHFVYASTKLHNHSAYLMGFTYLIKLYSRAFLVIVDQSIITWKYTNERVRKGAAHVWGEATDNVATLEVSASNPDTL